MATSPVPVPLSFGATDLDTEPDTNTVIAGLRALRHADPDATPPAGRMRPIVDIDAEPPAIQDACRRALAVPPVD